MQLAATTLTMLACLIAPMATAESSMVDNSSHDAVPGYAVTIAKAAAIISILNGTAMWLAPTYMLQVYKAPTGSVNVHLFQFKATSILSYGIVITSTLFAQQTLPVAVAFCQIPWILQAIRDFMNGIHNKLKVHPSNSIFPLVVGSLIVYSGLSSYSYANEVAKAFGAFICMNGLTMSFATKLHVQAWGGTEHPEEPIFESSLSATGWHLLAMGSLILFIDSGLDVPAAVGLSWIFFVVVVAIGIVQAKKFSLSVGKLLGWFGIHLVIMGGTLVRL